MTVYLSGRITNDHNWRRKFFTAIQKWEDKGYEVLSPIDSSNLVNNFYNRDISTKKLYDEYLKTDFELILRADAIVLLKDYIESPGALKELEFAIENKKNIMFD